MGTWDTRVVAPVSRDYFEGVEEVEEDHEVLGPDEAMHISNFESHALDVLEIVLCHKMQCPEGTAKISVRCKSNQISGSFSI